MNNKKAACPAGTRTSGEDWRTKSNSVCEKHNSRSGKSQAVVQDLLRSLNEHTRAVHIAAEIMVADGLCRYDSAEKCRKVWPPEEPSCVMCIENWLLARARKELKHD